MTREDVLTGLGYPPEAQEELTPGLLLMVDSIIFANEDAEKALEPYGSDVIDSFVEQALLAILEGGYEDLPSILRGTLSAGIILERRLRDSQVVQGEHREIRSGDFGSGLA